MCLYWENIQDNNETLYVQVNVIALGNNATIPLEKEVEKKSLCRIMFLFYEHIYLLTALKQIVGL